MQTSNPTYASYKSLLDSRRHVGIHAERVSNVSSQDFPGHYPDEDHSWDLDHFKANLTVNIRRLSGRSIDFDLVGVDPSIANAFRRILIAEVPTVCFEHVYVWNNTSVVADEVLSSRIGLVPLNVDPALFDMKNDPSEQATDRNTLVFKLQHACTRDPSTPRNAVEASEKMIGSQVLASHLQWVPHGEQEIVFADKAPEPTNPNIVLAKMRPGQEIDMELHAVKGVGKDHAKFSPVATASYRLLPLIVLNPKKPVPPHLAEKFQNCFSPGVIRVDPVTKEVSVDEEGMRNDTVSREVLRHKEFEGCVELKRVRDFFLFNIESEGPYAPERLFPEAIAIMREKIAVLKREVEELKKSQTGDVEMADA